MATQAPPKPDPNTYWVVPGKLLAGEYPGDVDSDEARRRLRRFLAAGVRHFVDLTELIEALRFLVVAVAELIKLALQPGSPDDRLNFLNFMVQTHLILDPDVRKGVGEYVANNKDKGQVPRYIGALSAVNQPEDVKTLLDQYQRIRATEPSGDERTLEMTVRRHRHEPKCLRTDIFRHALAGVSHRYPG